MRTRMFVWYGIFALIVGTLFFLTGLFSRTLEGVRWVTLPVVRLFSEAGQAFDAWRAYPVSDSQQRLAALERRVALLAVDYTRLRALEEENRALRHQAKFLFGSGFDSVGARVISREISQDHAQLLIDRGSRDSLEIGQAVVADNGIFIGKIARVQGRIARVELITDPRSRVAAAFADDGRLAGVVQGEGNGAAIMTYIPSSVRVEKDRVIVTSGIEEKIPSLLPLGIVNDVQGSPNDPFLRAVLEPLVSFEHIAFVSVLRPTALGPDSMPDL